MKAKTSQLGVLRTTLGTVANSIGFSRKEKVFIAKRSYFYRHGMTAEKLGDAIQKLLPEAKIVSTRDLWKPWPADSFFEVRFSYNPVVNSGENK